MVDKVLIKHLKVKWRKSIVYGTLPYVIKGYEYAKSKLNGIVACCRKRISNVIFVYVIWC